MQLLLWLQKGRGQYIHFSKKKYFSNLWRIILLICGDKLECSQCNTIITSFINYPAFWRDDKKFTNITHCGQHLQLLSWWRGWVQREMQHTKWGMPDGKRNGPKCPKMRATKKMCDQNVLAFCGKHETKKLIYNSFSGRIIKCMKQLKLLQTFQIPSILRSLLVNPPGY